MKQRPATGNKPNKKAIHHEKRKTMKFEKRELQKKVKAGTKKVTNDEDNEDVEPYNPMDEDKFEVGSAENSDVDDNDDYPTTAAPANGKKSSNNESSESSSSESEDEDDSSDDDSEIYDPALKKQQLKEQGKQHPPILVILDLASLETVKTRKGDFQLLNCDDHIGLIRKFHKDPSEYRPDIIHQELMTVLDSPLNKAGKLKILVHTEKNVLFEVSNKTRIPRTFKRFSGLMVQLLHRLKIRSSDGRDMLLKVIKNPISRHLPAGARVIGFSDQGTLQTPMQFAKTFPSVKEEGKHPPIVLIFGAQATKGILKEQHPYIEEMVSISEHGLSGVVAINRVLGAIETHWNIS